MAVEKTDLTIVNRNNKNYSATVREVNPPIEDYPSLPMPATIGWDGSASDPPQSGDQIVIEQAATGVGALVSNQWQREPFDQVGFVDIPGATGATYSIGDADQEMRVRLKQTFDGGVEMITNSLAVQTFPMPWDNEIGQYHIIVRAGANAPGIGNGNRFWMLFDGGTYAEVDAGQWTSFVQGSTDSYEDREYMITGENVAWFGTAPTSIGSNVDFGPLTDTTGVRNMSRMFDTCKNFNGDCSVFDVSQVDNMDYMFHECWHFNQDLSGWCVEHITSEPTNFHYSQLSDWQTSYKPQWGQPC